MIRRGGRYMVFPRAVLAELSGRHGIRDGLVEIWNGMPFLSPAWARGPRVAWIHQPHTEMWDRVLPPGRAAAGRIFERDLAPRLYRSTPSEGPVEASSSGIVVSHAGRTIPVDDLREAADIEGILIALDAVAAPGDRVFVGPELMARTNYSETYLYHLMTDYEPGSYHLQMNPGLANREGGRLAADIGAADWLLLTSKFDAWSEPNNSITDGDPRADALVESSFCAIETIGTRTLYGRC